jgi:lipid-A-disaccharide synthase
VRSPSTASDSAEARLEAGSAPRPDVRLFIVAGEHSGDALGAKLMAALNAKHPGTIRYLGVGGPGMAREGLASLFPLDDVAVMGPVAILPRLPRLLNRVSAAVAAALEAEPDAVVIIDSPEFTHPIARRIRRKRPDIPIINYVSPSVWAWRPGRARKMRAYVDHVLAHWPFEPAAHQRLGGPPCTFIGHALIERHAWIAALDPAPLAERLGLVRDRPVLVILPGSRSSEVARLMQPFGEAIARLLAGGEIELLMPMVPSVQRIVDRHLHAWPKRPHLIEGEEDKFRAFKLAQAALAASGTVTLELALTGTPMVVAYKVDALIAPVLRRLIVAPSIVLANLVLGENAFPEFAQEKCTGANLASALAPLLQESEARSRQLAALRRIPPALHVDKPPSEAAADIVLHYASCGRVQP